MPIAVDWYDENKTILIMRYQKGTEWAEFHQTFDDLDETLSTIQNRICIIHIVESLPKGSILSHINRVVMDTPDQIIIGIIVPASNPVSNAILQSILEVISRARATNQPFTFARNVDEAVEKAQHYVALVQATL